MYDLFVHAERFPDDIDAQIRKLLAACEVFVEQQEALLAHDGGWFPVGITIGESYPYACPTSWLSPGVDTGFELSVKEGRLGFSVHFSDTAPGWFYAAAAAVASSGELRDPQTGQVYRGSDLGAMLEEIDAARWPAQRPAPARELARELVTFGRVGHIQRRRPSDELRRRNAEDDAAEEEAILNELAKCGAAGATPEELVPRLYEEYDPADDDEVQALYFMAVEATLVTLQAEGRVAQKGGRFYFVESVTARPQD